MTSKYKSKETISQTDDSDLSDDNHVVVGFSESELSAKGKTSESASKIQEDPKKITSKPVPTSESESDESDKERSRHRKKKHKKDKRFAHRHESKGKRSHRSKKKKEKKSKNQKPRGCRDRLYSLPGSRRKTVPVHRQIR